jgi:glycosyltransferase involved in cell wall biosynthesis
MPEPPEAVVSLAHARAAARAAKDFAAADDLRDQIALHGWAILDVPEGWRLEIAPAPAGGRSASVKSSSVDDVLGRAPDHDVSVQWVLDGWPEDIERALGAFRARAGGRWIQYVVVDVTGGAQHRWREDVEVVRVPAGTGWAVARNAGLRRARGRIVLALDGSIEPAGDVFGPLESALIDDGVGICGPYGLMTHDLRRFAETVLPGDCDAIEGYLMAFRREIVTSIGGFDERFSWYRSADIEWSFRVKDRGLRTVVVEVPVRRHEHRAWISTSPEERERLSKRNFYRFLDRWRGRWDLVLSGDPGR